MKEIQKISITDAVVSNIRDMIESKTYQVGDRLPTEAMLCSMFRVSRTSVREAIRVLQALGYVTISPGKGTFVASTTPSKSSERLSDIADVKFNDFMEVRHAIEPLAVRLAISRASEEEIEELHQIHLSFVEAVNQRDSVRMIMLDELFHTKIVDFTKNNLLVSINKNVLDAFRVYRSSSFMNADVYANAVRPHELILQCFYDRDPAKGVLEIQRHLDITARDMELIHHSSANKSIISPVNNPTAFITP